MKMMRITLAVILAAMSVSSVCGGAEMSPERMNTFLKYRTQNMRKDLAEYREGYEKYLDLIRKEKMSYSDVRIKICFVEAVLKFLNGAKTIGLEEYAKMLKEAGDVKYADKQGQIEEAIICCDELLSSGKASGKEREVKDEGVEFQKAELLMFRWLVKNAASKKGKMVGSFPDDKGNLGVCDREEAIRIINDKAWNVEGASELLNQCVRILVSDSGCTNWITFNGKNFFSYDNLKAEACGIVKGKGTR